MPADSRDMVLVPLRATEAMIEAAQDQLDAAHSVSLASDSVEIVWSAMLSASPVRGEGDAGHDGIFSPFNACCYRETCRAMARARPTPATPAGEDLREKVARHLMNRFTRSDYPVPWERLSAYGKENWLAEADAILAALQPQAEGE